MNERNAGFDIDQVLANANPVPNAAVRNADAACYQHLMTWAVGCDKVTTGCTLCIALPIVGTYKQHVKKGVVRQLPDGRFVWNGHLWIADLDDDSVWLKPQRIPGSGQFIYVNLLSDCFHEKIPTEIIHLGFDAIAASRHYGMFCTKRCERVPEVIAAASAEEVRLWQPKCLLGFTAENRPCFNERWPHMRSLAEKGWFIFGSFSPLLEAFELPDDYWNLACWTIVSGEQGDPTRTRDMRPEWAEAILDKCDRVGMPFFFREMSSHQPQIIANKLQRRDFPSLPIARSQSLTFPTVPARRTPEVNLPRVPSTANRIISLRDTHGAGKSTIVRNLLEANDARPIHVDGARRPEAYQLSIAGQTYYVIGPYLTECGGCDAVRPYELIAELIKKYSQRGHVVFEGAVISSYWGAIGALLERWKRNAIIAFLDTSVEESIRRVQERRTQRGDDRVFNPKNLIQKHEAIARLKLKLEAAGIVTVCTIANADDLLLLLNAGPAEAPERLGM